MRLRLQPDSRDSGAIAVVVAVFAVVMFGFGAIVVDLGLAREIRSGAQNTADAAALAGAGALYDTNGVPLRVEDSAQVVRDFAARNGTPAGEWDTCAQNDPPDGYTPMGSGSACILYADDDSDVDTDPDRVWVSLPAEDSPSIFGGVIGYEGTSIGAVAEAEVQSRPRTACALCVLGMLDASNSDVSVHGGGSVHADRGEVGSIGSISAQDVGTIEFARTPAPASGDRYTPNPPLVTGMPVPDPFAPFMMPPWTGAMPRGDSDCDDVNLLPGIYEDLDVEGSCTLQPGIYFITGRLDVSGTGRLEGAGATTLVFVCGSGTSPAACRSNGEDGGELRVQDQGTLILNSPGFSGFSVLYDANNSSDLRLVNRGNVDVADGAVYAARSRLVIRNRAAADVHGRVVVGEVDMDGSDARLSITGQDLPQVPPRRQLALAPAG